MAANRPESRSDEESDAVRRPRRRSVTRAAEVLSVPLLARMTLACNTASPQNDSSESAQQEEQFEIGEVRSLDGSGNNPSDATLGAVGGTAVVLVHEAIHGVPYSLAVACMLAAVPGSYLQSPRILTFIAVITIGLDAHTAAPVAMTVLTSCFLASTVVHLRQQGEVTRSCVAAAGEDS